MNFLIVFITVIVVFIHSVLNEDKYVDTRPKTYELTKEFLLSDCDRRRKLALKSTETEPIRYITEQHLLDHCNCIHRSIMDAANDVANNQSDLHKDYIELAYMLYFNTPKPEKLDARLSKAMDSFFKQRIIKNKPKLVYTDKFIDKLNSGYASCKASANISTESMERYNDQYHSRKR